MQRDASRVHPTREFMPNRAGRRLGSVRSLGAMFGLGLVLGLVLVGAVAGAQQPKLRGEPWPEADRLFHRDPRWLGADAAFSVPLEGGRVLWLFGDTFVATSAAHRRSESRMVRNTVGLQTGTDPSAAEMRFFWRGEGATPQSFFPEDGERWYWPQHGICLGKRLLLFLMRMRATPGKGLGFTAEGWRAAVVDDASGDPSGWSVRLLAPEFISGLIVGAAVCELDEHVVALAIREPGDHAGYLVRWPRAALMGDGGALVEKALRRCDVWIVDRWCDVDLTGIGPTVVLRDAGPESSLQHDAALGRWVHVKSVGFGATTIGVSFAERIEGPWSEPAIVYRPPESERPEAFVYAAKAHPELTGAPLVLTFASNTLGDFATLVKDEALYYPRFVRLRVVE
jgi:hypothetical protein